MKARKQRPSRSPRDRPPIHIIARSSPHLSTTSSSASLAIVLRENSDTRLMLPRLACPPPYVRELLRDKPVAPPPFTPGEPGREPPVDCRLRLLTMLLTEPPDTLGPRARRGPRRRFTSVIVGVVGDGVMGFVGEGLRELCAGTRGDAGRLLPGLSAGGMCAWGGGGEIVSSRSGGGSLNAGGLVGGEAGSGGGGANAGMGMLPTGDSTSGSGSLNIGRGGRSSVSGGGSLNMGGAPAACIDGGGTAGAAGALRGGGGGIWGRLLLSWM